MRSNVYYAAPRAKANAMKEWAIVAIFGIAFGALAAWGGVNAI